MMDRAEVWPFLQMSPPLVFVNPAASRVRAFLPRIRKTFDSLGIPAQFVPTNNSQDLELAAGQAVSQNPSVLFAMGGDGTFQALANGAFGADVVLGVLPVGGGNDFAAALGIPRNPLKAVAAILRGRPRPIDLVSARTADGKARFYVGGGGVGLDAEAAAYASGSYRHLPGRIRYIASALRALATYSPLEVQMKFTGSEPDLVSAKCLLAGVLKTPTYGAGLRLAPVAAVDDQLLHVVLLEDLSFPAILKLLPGLLASGELRTSRVRRWSVKRVRLTTNRPCLFHGDGEILGSTPVVLEVVPRAIQVLAPAFSPMPSQNQFRA